MALTAPTVFNLKAIEDYESLDRVIAIVEKSVVTKRELEKAISLILKKLKKAERPIPNQNVLIKEILDRLIEKKLILQYSELIGIKIEGQYLESVIGNIAKKNGLTIEELRKQLKEEGIPFNEFKEGISYELILNRVKEKEITSKINVSDFEIKNFLKKIKSKVPSEFKISHILLKKENGYNVGGEKINEILNQLKTVSFSNIAINKSQGPMAPKGGSLGWKKIEDLPKLFSEVITKMNVGDISKPLISENGIHILRLDEAKNVNKNNKKIMSEQYSLSQLLIKVNEINNEDDIKRQMNNIKNQIIEGLPFSEAASKFSEDLSSSQGGNLGWVDKSVMLPDYKNAVEASKLGEVSGPFSTEIGWVLLLVTEKRNKDITDEKNMMSARVELLQKKTQTKYKDWLDSLKSQVHIEILLNE
jgi:peptidyl-prolyl cis-trans isomerase SurA|tara:strand:+ start:469 stop:1722 length:1254 start_codon:yes stop_codon:yes gene_type:complete